MTQRKKPTRAERKARKEERHEIVRSIMQEPDDVIHFPVAFGRIAMNAALWGAVALGVLALGVLSSAVFLMRDEIAGLGRQLQQKDADLNILSGELQKVRDQMFGEQIVEQQGTMTVKLVDAESGVARAVSGVTLKDTPYPLGPESRAVNGKYLYWTDEEGILRVNLEDGTSYRIVTKPFISSIAVSKEGMWLAYAYSQGLSDPESVGKTLAVAMPLSGRGDPIELGVIGGCEISEMGGFCTDSKILGFSTDGKDLLWTTFMAEGVGQWWLHRTRVVNGQTAEPFLVSETPGFVFLGFSPDGSVAALLEESNGVRLVLIDTSTERRRVRYIFPEGASVTASASWSTDGSEIVLYSTEGLQAFPLKGTTAPALISTPPFPEDVEVAYSPGKFVLTLTPSLAGQYSYRNLATDAISSGEGPFSEIIGWSTDLNAVVLLEDTRE